MDGYLVWIQWWQEWGFCHRHGKCGELVDWFTIVTAWCVWVIDRYDVAIADTVSSFGGVEGQPVFISFAGVEGEVANEIAAKIKETADCKVTVSQNRRIQSTGIIGIYFCGE